MPVTPIKSRKPQPDEGVINVLNQLLEHAKDGRLKALYIVGEAVSGKVYRGHALRETTNLFQMAGALEYAHRHVLNLIQENEAWPT